MRRDLMQKAKLVTAPAENNASETAGVESGVGEVDEKATGADAERRSPRTSPGSMQAFMRERDATFQENKRLQARLEAFDGTIPAKHIDPQLVVDSKWANRHAESYQSAEFASLKADIASAGGNVQPIKVRPLQDPTQGGPHFEVVFGHRRHRACLELGLPVLALIHADIDDRQLYLEMERENRDRSDVSAWEQGKMYSLALEQGMFSSNSQLAQAIGKDVSQVGKAISIAKLPDDVVAAFGSPLVIQYAFAPDLRSVQQVDPDGLIARAKQIIALDHQPSPKAVQAMLTTGAGLASPSSRREPPRKWKSARGKVLATMTNDGRKSLRISFGTDLDGEQHAKFRTSLERLMDEIFSNKH